MWADRAAQCQRNVTAAQADALAAVRYVRTHASQYGIELGLYGNERPPTTAPVCTN